MEPSGNCHHSCRGRLENRIRGVELHLSELLHLSRRRRCCLLHWLLFLRWSRSDWTLWAGRGDRRQLRLLLVTNGRSLPAFSSSWRCSHFVLALLLLKVVLGRRLWRRMVKVDQQLILLDCNAKRVSVFILLSSCFRWRRSRGAAGYRKWWRHDWVHWLRWQRRRWCLFLTEEVRKEESLEVVISTVLRSLRRGGVELKSDARRLALSRRWGLEVGLE